MSEQVRVDTTAVSGLAGEVSGVGAVVRTARDTAGSTRFGPGSVGPALRDHAGAYATGIRAIRAEIEAMASSVDRIAVGLCTAAREYADTDTASGSGIEAAGRPR